MWWEEACVRSEGGLWEAVCGESRLSVVGCFYFSTCIYNSLLLYHNFIPIKKLLV